VLPLVLFGPISTLLFHGCPVRMVKMCRWVLSPRLACLIRNCYIRDKKHAFTDPSPLSIVGSRSLLRINPCEPVTH
jgi:hypothetical protein